ncbi:MAG: hypothetical protein MRY75_04990 [Marivita sp.]|uniref:hypothetical protein n=1 Tax=Marivita sp. TaxID=2003365 RepID=UPI0025B809BE|nr:hypothetical protein [Marivita sp.]MCI5109888.1 hypothetical protein [Marivita sp.]
MGWTYSHKKMREALRKTFTDETGLPHTAPEFEAWLKAKGHLPSEAGPVQR